MSTGVDNLDLQGSELMYSVKTLPMVCSEDVLALNGVKFCASSSYRMEETGRLSWRYRKHRVTR